ncbi:unnamed protein product [Paramecium primaurelia]|uniref:Uncharacterized protein n=1 Tax=Paramecium primaurelia TaxID=5886 RepID=A0A8S1NT89_PARPR|nr:unnamed protein product [Paramecium primaurelia]
MFINFKSFHPYDNVQLFIDDTPIEYEETNIEYSNYTCGSIFLSTISIIHQHNRRSGWIKILQPIGGIISFCVKWNLHQLSFNQKLLTLSDGWTLTPNYLDIATSFCGGCEYLKFQEISYSTELPPHQHILIRFYKGSSSSIQLDYMYDPLIFLEDVYFVEIVIKNYFNSILNLNIKTVLSTDQSWIRDFEIYYTLPEISFLSLNEGCQDQIGDRCLNCRDGWIEDEYQSYCIPICGDTIIQGYEECDDGNLISNDGCFQCKYQCNDSCKTCIFGICKLCLNGFVLNENNNCEPQCGDGIVIPYSTEQCDVKSENDLNGCKDCRYMSIPYCQQSYFSTCLECYQGFSILDNVCYPYCGDKRALEQIEQLNDSNLTIYVNCIFCEQRFCGLKCKDGYEYINQSCNPICGDQIVTIEEECDDGNTIMFDGCFDCNYSCPENCHDCYQGICFECKSQYIIQESNQCKLQVICGDGLVQQQEECDDGNNQASDGCMNCLIEQNWILQANVCIQKLPIQSLIISI